jgi:hypothetical protein
LLRLDWTTRLSSDVALKHPWIADATVAPSEALDVVKQLGNFQSSCRLKRAVGRVLAKRMTEKDVAALQAAFDEFDSNGDGILGPEEIASMVKRIGHNEKGAQEFLELLDEDGDGVIRYDACVYACRMCLCCVVLICDTNPCIYMYSHCALCRHPQQGRIPERACRGPSIR